MHTRNTLTAIGVLADLRGSYQAMLAHEQIEALRTLLDMYTGRPAGRKSGSRQLNFRQLASELNVSASVLKNRPADLRFSINALTEGRQPRKNIRPLLAEFAKSWSLRETGSLKKLTNSRIPPDRAPGALMTAMVAATGLRKGELLDRVEDLSNGINALMALQPEGGLDEWLSAYLPETVIPTLREFAARGVVSEAQTVTARIPAKSTRPATCKGCDSLTEPWSSTVKGCLQRGLSAGDRNQSCEGYTRDGTWIPQFLDRQEPVDLVGNVERLWSFDTGVGCVIQAHWDPGDLLDTAGTLTVRTVMTERNGRPYVTTLNRTEGPVVGNVSRVTVVGPSGDPLYESPEPGTQPVQRGRLILEPAYVEFTVPARESVAQRTAPSPSARKKVKKRTVKRKDTTQ